MVHLIMDYCEDLQWPRDGQRSICLIIQPSQHLLHKGSFASPPFEGMAHANHDGFEVYCAYNDNRNVEKLYPYIIHAKPFAIILAF